MRGTVERDIPANRGEPGMWEWRKFVRARGPAKIFGPEVWCALSSKIKNNENTGLRDWLGQFWPWFRRSS